MMYVMNIPNMTKKKKVGAHYNVVAGWQDSSGTPPGTGLRRGKQSTVARAEPKEPLAATNLP